MFLNLSKIRTAQERYDLTYQPGAFADSHDDFSVVEPVRLGFDIHKDQDRFRLVGRVQTTLELACSRCLEPFRWPVDMSFDLAYLPLAVNAGEGEREVKEDDLSTAFYENDQLDLGQLMREQFYLALPMKPLCSDSCRGLCAQCGMNLNRGTCDCRVQWDDPRLAALRNLKTDHPREH